ncbi:Rieske (2Fe-2S) protein [Acidipila rosea]|uniref:Nitrite reductase (NADH) small subunit n=1 Tax=Acidipila rosea TaxID=768535 RepID=A0A4R1LAB1_9BACT|nr:Rieske (2Fe-2S) protein [Acidipila rosea]MBW4043564.1 Rieske (2Fe-2S) protein [Acidobacteriota bacterium]TCK73863.1 nitrite reductase (NADH) small subunit [Acidipila rosea]
MSDFVRICSKADLPPVGHVAEIAAAGKVLCIANIKGVISALDNECPHRGGPLGQGTIEDGMVMCPWHAWAFNVKTGCASHHAQTCVQVYPVEIRGDEVMAKL